HHPGQRLAGVPGADRPLDRLGRPRDHLDLGTLDLFAVRRGLRADRDDLVLHRGARDVQDRLAVAADAGQGEPALPVSRHVLRQAGPGGLPQMLPQVALPEPEMVHADRGPHYRPALQIADAPVNGYIVLDQLQGQFALAEAFEAAPARAVAV